MAQRLKAVNPLDTVAVEKSKLRQLTLPVNIVNGGLPIMHSYHGKAKCSCGKRATKKANNDGNPKFRCNQHAYQLHHLPDEETFNRMTEADRQTWGRLR